VQREARLAIAAALSASRDIALASDFLINDLACQVQLVKQAA